MCKAWNNAAITKLALVFALVVAAAISSAQILTVTTPTNGSFLGRTNKIKFTVTNANVEVTMRAEITGPGGPPPTVISERFTPNADGKIDAELPLNFSESAPEGAYTIVVTGTRNEIPAPPPFGTVTINVTVDVVNPKILQFNPINGAFVRDTVQIRVRVREPNFKDYRVQINGQDIPGNTGNSLDPNDEFTVIWNTDGILSDGEQSINIRIRDEASNEVTQDVSVTLDRVPPVVNIVQPRANVRMRPRSHVSVSVDIEDDRENSIHVTGVDVIAKTLGGAFIGRVARQSFRSVSESRMRWSGRLRYSSRLPTVFKIEVTVVDRAGNVAVTQEVIVRY